MRVFLVTSKKVILRVLIETLQGAYELEKVLCHMTFPSAALVLQPPAPLCGHCLGPQLLSN